MAISLHRIRLRVRRMAGLLLSGTTVLWLVGLTASCSSAEAALRELGKQRDFMLSVLSFQLGQRQEDAFPTSVNLMISQSPALIAGKKAVLELRGTEEEDDTAPPSPLQQKDSLAPLPRQVNTSLPA